MRWLTLQRGCCSLPPTRPPPEAWSAGTWEGSSRGTPEATQWVELDLKSSGRQQAQASVGKSAWCLIGIVL